MSLKQILLCNPDVPCMKCQHCCWDPRGSPCAGTGLCACNELPKHTKSTDQRCWSNKQSAAWQYMHFEHLGFLSLGFGVSVWRLGGTVPQPCGSSVWYSAASRHRLWWDSRICAHLVAWAWQSHPPPGPWQKRSWRCLACKWIGASWGLVLCNNRMCWLEREKLL